MWPWGHLGVGYVLWSVWCRGRDRAPPTTTEFWLVVLGTQLPDLVDKPLAWTLGVLPSGRSLAHSLLTAAVVVAVVTRLGRRYDRERLASCFSLAFVSHPVADALVLVLGGRTEYLGFLLWPATATPYSMDGRSLTDALGRLLHVDVVSPYVLPVVGFVLLWLADGRPGYPSWLR